ncbi:hypothetical protein B5G52_12375 [Pseudoalteromonas sp. A601]|uniref:hypothetical protein n=1 Tax=Pseudoalteromonas sp. A601 TaxID=1967839 RepID=UPI000B3D0400|nr:hypothetical protein [Pseudoalteromonas sp. A601]OUS70994.1 hypothetical protein B5G52_12375 [Pseudoalteromonas sp. A601]
MNRFSDQMKMQPKHQKRSEDENRELLSKYLIDAQNYSEISIGTSLALISSDHCLGSFDVNYELHYKIMVFFKNVGLFNHKQALEYGVIDEESYDLLNSIASGACPATYSELAPLNEIISVLGESFVLSNTTMSDNSLATREEETIGTGNWRTMMEMLTKARKNKLIKVKDNTNKKHEFLWYEYFEEEFNFSINVTNKYSEIMNKVEPTRESIEDYWAHI